MRYIGAMNEHSEVFAQRGPDESSLRSETGGEISHPQASEGFAPHSETSGAKVSRVRNADVVSVGEAAKILGVSVSSVQRLCDAHEANPRAEPPVGLRFRWTSPHSGRVDVHGREMKGRRRVFRSALEEYLVASKTEALPDRVLRVTARAAELGVSIGDLIRDASAVDRRRHALDAAARQVARTLDEIEERIREAEGSRSS